MKITKEEDYAILFMTVLAAASHKLVSLQEVSDNYDIPYYFLKKIARQLRESDLVKAKEGAAGGYALRVPASKLNLAEIVEAIRGQDALATCVGNVICQTAEFQQASTVLQAANRDVRMIFAKIKLSDMVRGLDVE